MNKILVVGSKGFIGQHMIRYLKNQNRSVWGADVVVEYEDADKYFLIDATNSDFQSIFEQVDFDLCVNCSGAASVPDSISKPFRDFKLNSSNVFKLLEAIRVYRPECKFINLSSAAVYGNPDRLPIKESFTRNPLSPYGYHKSYSEQICEEFHRFFQIKTCSMRIFSAYGEGLKKQLFWDLYQKAKTNGRVHLFGSGRESRDFIYIKDLVHAIYIVAQHAKFSGDVINIANGEEIFIEDCVKTFYSFFDGPIEYEFTGKNREGDPDNWVADIQKLKALGYNRKYSLEKGLKKYYEWAETID